MIELRVYSSSVISVIPELSLWALLLVSCIGLGLSFWKNGLKEGLCYGAILLLVEWTFLVLGVTVLFRESNGERAINLIPLSSYFDYAENTYLMEKAAINILNVAMFLPIGLLLGYGLKNMTWPRVLTIGVSLSISIELLQLVLKKGLCETDDVIHNVLGCIIGYCLYKLTVKFVKNV